MLKPVKYFPIFIILGLNSSLTFAEIHVVVSAARTEQSTLTTPASISVISREQIEASGASHIVDVLRGHGGVQIIDSFGNGSRSSVGMRGFGETANANTLVLVNGRRLNNPDIASPDFNSIALEDVDRIEIVQGGAGVLFGDQAVGGVINIITREADDTHSIKISAGSYSTRKLYAKTSQVLENGINYRVFVDARESDNYRDNNESSYLNAMTNIGYEYSVGSVFAELQYTDDELDTPGTLFDNELNINRRQINPNFANDFSDLETKAARLGIDHDLAENWAVEAELTSRDVDGVFRLSSVFGAATQDSTQERTVKEFTPRLIGILTGLNNTSITLGADFVESDYKLSSMFGDQINDQSQRSIYVHMNAPIASSTHVTLGVRNAEVENSLIDTGLFAIFPSGQQVDESITVGEIGITYKPSDEWRYLLRVDQNFRFAKVDEYMSPTFTPSFSPVILKPQEGVSIEGGIEWRSNKQEAKFLIYQLDLDNEFAFDPVIFANINIDETRRQGAIASGFWQLTDKLGVAASLTYTDAEIMSGASEGKEVPLIAKRSGYISGQYRVSHHWQLYSEIQAQSDRVFSGDFNNVLGRLPGYGIVNLKAEYTKKDFSLTARINNLFDKEYTDVGQLGTDPMTFADREAFFPSPELNFMLTAAWEF